MPDYKTKPDESGYWDEIHIISDAINGYCVVEIHTNGDLYTHSHYILTFEEEKTLIEKGFIAVK